ncbi:MAG: YbaB/EbfC family nucleoid-associated protein [Candidatus Berkelbacteria bacterium]|nr:YbaB/EbfC family nucleoid-associated protein [Candidatus Berkelbacteria bacterium]
MVDFGKMKELYEFQKKARAIQKELKEVEIEASSNDGWVTVVFNGESHLTEVNLTEEALRPENKRELEKDLKNTISQAISRAQAVAAEKAKAIAGGMGIPGL